MTHEARELAHRALLYALLLACAALTLLPYVWMLSSSFKENIEIFSARIDLIPDHPILDNYVAAIDKHPVIRAILNSVIMAGVETLAVVVTSVFTAYPFARLRFPGRDVLFLLILGTMMIPSQVTMIPAFILIKWLGWIDSYQGLIVPRIMTPLGIFLMRQFLLTLPRELEEAARIDGCSTPYLIWRIVVPLLAPGLAATAILTFIFSWNEFTVALNLTAKQTATIPVAIAKFAQGYEIKYGEMAATAALSLVPALVFLLFGQRYIVKGLTTGAVK